LIDFVEAEGSHAQVAKLLRQGRLATTAVSAFELWRGCETEEQRELTRSALRGVRIYAFNAPAAQRAGELSRELEQSGVVIGERDMMIAAVCLAVKLPLLTRNLRHFARVPGLILARH